MGGVCKGKIRTARSNLNALLKTHRRRLNDEALRTLLIEVEAIVNSRPMTTEAMNDVQSHVPLSPSNLLTMKLKIVMPPPGSFRPADAFCHKRWRRAQHIVNGFWARWRKEFIQSLQEQKLCRSKPGNFQKKDIVLLKADYNQNNWPMARIIETFLDKHRFVRTIKLRLGDAVATEQRELDQPITKIVLLVESDSRRRVMRALQNSRVILGEPDKTMASLLDY